jgi:hypothetical protein
MPRTRPGHLASVAASAGQSAASDPADAVLSLVLLSLLASAFVSVAVSVEPDEVPLPAVLALSDGADLRLSVTYQPLPLKTIAGGVRTRRASIPQTSQVWTDGASNPSRFSYWWPALQR